MDFTAASLAELTNAIRSRQLSSVDAVTRALDAISDRDPELGAFITVDGERALAAAAAADREMQRQGHRGALHGIPIAVKDMFLTEGLRTTAGSRILRSWIPDHDAAAVAALRRAGAVIIGKTHTTEFAVWGTGGHPMYSLPRNPWDTSRIPGGSSGGSAVSVGAGLVPAALATDTGGSSRIPASLCGVVGFKPTRAAIPTSGTIPLSWSHDHVGIITRTIADCRTLFHSLRRLDGQRASGASPGELKIGVLPCAPSHAAASVEAALARFRECAAERPSTVRTIGADWAARAAHISRTVQYPELVAYHRRAFGARDRDYGADVRTGLSLGRQIAAVDYAAAQRDARQLTRDVDDALKRYDVLASATVAFGAPPLGTRTIHLGGSTHQLNALISQHTRLFNVTGHPAVTIPWDADEEGMPIGLQLIGARGDDDRVLAIAEGFERASRWVRRAPQVGARAAAA